MKKFLIALTVLVMFVAAFSTSVDARRHYDNDDCPWCFGTGVCQECDGRGSWTEERYDEDDELYEETVYCDQCNGIGSCWYCSGTGSY